MHEIHEKKSKRNFSLSPFVFFVYFVVKKWHYQLSEEHWSDESDKSDKELLSSKKALRNN